MFNKLKKFVSKVIEITNVQDNVDECLNQILPKEILDGRLIENLTITAGTPLRIDHKLGRQIRGYIIISQDTNLKIYDSLKSDKFLTLNIDAVSTLNITDWVSYTPTVEGITADNKIFEWRRVGDSIDIRGYIRGTVNVTGTIYVYPPSGLSLEPTKIDTTGTYDITGVASAFDSGVGYYIGTPRCSAVASKFFISDSNGATGWNATTPMVWAAADRLSVDMKHIPISGWEKYTTTYPETNISLWVF